MELKKIMYNKKITLFLLALAVLLISATAVSASDNITDSTGNTQLSQADDNAFANDIESVKEDNKVINKNIKKSYDPYTGVIGDDFTGNIHEVNEDSYTTYFDEKGYLTDNVENGDILDIQGKISDKSGININKPVNIISTTKDGEFNNVSIFTFKKESSYSNMTGLKVTNSKFFIENATTIVINNVNVSIVNTSLGLGTGMFSIRDASDHITFANSNIYCENNGGTSLGVIAAAQYCTFENCTFKGVGNVGNLLYLTTYNVASDKMTNDYNRFINNTIEKTDSAAAISYGIGLIGKHNEFINNTIHTKGIGITMQWGSTPDTASNNYFEGNTFDCSSAATFPYSTYVNNTFLTGSAVTFVNNTNATKCRFNNSVSLQNNVSFIDNIVNSPSSNYAVSIVGNTSVVKDNGLTAKSSSGDNAVNSKYDNCIIENNDNRKDFKKAVEYILSEDTYYDFFNSDGELIVDFNEGDAFLVSGEILDKEFYINNAKVIFKDYEENHGVLVNPKFIATDNGHIVLDGLEIFANDEYLENIIYLDTSGNQINNTTITQVTDGEKAHSVIIKADNNTITNSRFELSGPSMIVDYEHTPNLAPIVNVVVYSSNNIIRNNSFSIKATTSSDFGTVEALTFQNDFADITNNTIEDNTIIGNGTDYIYGINFGGRVYDSIVKNNTINITSLKYVDGIQFMMSPASNNKIIENKINITAGEDDGYVAYGIVLSSWGGETFENNTINSNNIILRANQVYGIEVFSNVASSTPAVINTTIVNNTITANAVFASGIAIMGTTFNITSNHLDIEGQTNETGDSADYIKPTTAGIILQKVTDSTVYDNFIGVGYGPTNKIIQNSNNITIEENILYSTQGVSSDSIVTISGSDINIGVNYPIQEAQITVTGDYIIGEKSELTVSLLDKNGNILKKANGTVIISIYDDEKIELVNGQATYVFVGEDTPIIGTAYYLGSEIIQETENKFTLEASANVNLKFEDAKAVIGEDLPLVVYVESGKDEINEGTVIFYVGDEEITREDVKDNMVKTSCHLNNNWYKKDITITAKYTDSKTYPDAETTMKPTILIPTLIETQQFKDIKIGKSISGIFRINDTISNSPITPKVTAYINGKEDGKISFNGQIRAFMYSYTPTEVGEYEIKFVYEGSVISGYSYNASQTTVKVNVEGYDTTLNIEDIETKTGIPTTIAIAVTSPDQVTVDGGVVTITDENDNILATCEVTAGQASCEITFNNAGTTVINAVYESADGLYKQSQTQVNVLVEASTINPTIVISPVVITKGENTTITATVIGNNGEVINAGKVAFKLNGKTLKDANSKVIYAKVVDGQVNISVFIDESQLKDSNNITAVYSGSTGISSAKAQTSDVTIKEAEVNLSLAPTTAKAGSNVKITVNVTTASKAVNEGKIVLKVNGKTVKDANGKVVYANVVNGIATIDYDIASNMKAKNYTITAVFISNNYSRVSCESTLTIEDN
ncbi:MAG: hypothetical protein BZ133_01175 [Methanosphaera sp. SHI613]|nr:MAG: hypothetical protein BZ133_01175 [Methanosphaera sp. SHI613]